MKYTLISEDCEGIELSPSLISYSNTENIDIIHIILPEAWFNDKVHDNKIIYECKNCNSFLNWITGKSKKDWFIKDTKGNNN